jgi:hypothetical protein
MQSTECEPYLLDYRVEFHSIFTLIDPTMNTSEIRLLHLAVPRNRQGVRAAPSGQPNIKKPAAADGGPPNQRFLSNRTTTQKRSDSTPAKPDAMAQAAQGIVNATTTPAAPAPAPAIAPEQANLVTSLVATPEFWIYPLPPVAPVTFFFTVEGTTGPLVFRLRNAMDDSLLLSAKINGSSPSSALTIFTDKGPLGQGSFSNRTLHFGISAVGAINEAAAASYIDGSHLFDFVVPAIKKSGKGDVRPRMCPIPFGKTSNLMIKLQEQSKEAIQMKSRDPGKPPDFTFGGQFQESSPLNFVLFHASNAAKDICSMSVIGAGRFLLAVGYPLSPMQGFLAGIASALPV